MREQEKVEKIIRAKEDIKTLENLLDKFDLQRANNAVSKIMSNIDYAQHIVASRIANNVPVGRLPFGSLDFTEKMRVINMLLAAVKSALVDFISQ